MLRQIISNANDNKDETKNLFLRTQLEADLASTDGSAFVALYETPSRVCLPSQTKKDYLKSPDLQKAESFMITLNSIIVKMFTTFIYRKSQPISIY